ncbi:Permease of the drug/metabolite transporter (DMT) superfamily [Ruminococcaceae bacterium YRB3002]|nr:Permease of the drug/metabolite transporter (DMT) superfamily [Ruminococcaceae bacterium YRB3002]
MNPPVISVRRVCDIISPMRRSSPKGIILLLLTALIWGISFVAQSVGSDVLEPFAYNGIRTFMGAVVLAVFILVTEYSKNRSFKKLVNRKLLLHGTILGLVFTFASNFQQFAFNDSSAGKIAFITALYMFFVPVIGIFLRRRIHPVTWICVFAAVIGLYLLSVKDGDFTNINKGDILALICAFFFAVHILLIDKFVAESDGVKLSCIQFAVAGVITLVLMFIFEHPTAHDVKLAAVPLLYSGIMSCGVAYTLQMVGQKYTNPVTASLLMCLESVFAVLSAALLIKEIPTLREGIGCVVIFAAIIVSQIVEFRFRNKSC